MKVYLFYGTQVVAEFEEQKPVSSSIRDQFGQEIYDGGYVYAPTYNKKWWRCDATPLLLDDVPKELRALALLLT